MVSEVTLILEAASDSIKPITIIPPSLPVLLEDQCLSQSEYNIPLAVICSQIHNLNWPSQIQWRDLAEWLIGATFTPTA